MNHFIKALILSTSIGFTGVSYAELENPFGEAPAELFFPSQVSMSVTQSKEVGFLAQEATLIQDPGTVRNFARINMINFDPLRVNLFSNGFNEEGNVVLRITINDRARVDVPILFEEGQEELIIGRARPTDFNDLITDGSALNGRIRADYDEVTETFTIRYTERVNVSGDTRDTELAIPEADFNIRVAMVLNHREQGRVIYVAEGKAPRTSISHGF